MKNLGNFVELIEQQLFNLKQEIDQNHFVLFVNLNSGLFKTQYSEEGYSPYLDEIQYNLDQLKSLLNQVLSKREMIAFLVERIGDQLVTLQSALQNRGEEDNSPSKVKKSIHDYHAEHLGYLKRLEEIKFEIEHEIPVNPDKLRKIKYRIERCTDKIKSIEERMERLY